MSKVKYITHDNAVALYCPVLNNECRGQGCMLWIDSMDNAGPNADKGYCGFLGSEGRASRTKAVLLRMIAWLWV